MIVPRALATSAIFLTAILSIDSVGAQQTAAPRKPEPPQKAEEKKPVEKKPDYSQEPFVIESFRTVARFEADGTGTRETTMRIRVQSDAGVQQLGQLMFGYNSANERLAIDYVRVHKELGGAVVTAKPDAVQEMTAPVARDAPVYTDYKQKHVTVPGLRPGEILEYKTTVTLHTPLAPGNFWLEYEFEKNAILLDEQLEVNVPSARPLKLKTAPEHAPEISEASGRTLYRWKSSHTVREDNEDETATRKREQKKRRKEPEAPDVQLTTFQSWEEVGRWYAALERDRVAPSDEIRQRAAELVRNRPGDLEKIAALYDFVAKNFRYVSLSFGLGRYQPHAAPEILANQYGDCKDKHTLLAALLEAAGFKSYPALIHHGRKVDPEMPSPSQFDHVISVVPLGKESLWMDTTTEVAPFRLLSANIRKKQALVIPRDGTPSLVETPANPPFPSLDRTEIDGTVSDLGKLSARVHHTMRGDNELLLRAALRRTPQTQWKQLAQAIAGFAGLRGEVKEVKPGDITNTDKAFELEYQVEVANFLDWTGKKSQLGIPLPAVGLPEADPENEEDGDAIDLGSPIEIVAMLRLKLPEKFTARAPVPVSVVRDYGEYHSTYKLEGNTLTAGRRLKSSARELPAARTRDYLSFVRAVRADESQAIHVETTAAGALAIPENVTAEDLNNAGMAALQKGEFALAEELFQRVVEKEPKHKWVWNDLGLARLAQRKLGPAAEAFQKQIEINPYHDYAYNNLGRALWQQQKFDDAASAFRKQIEINPLDRWAHANLGSMWREQKKYLEAVTELEKAMAITPQDANLYVSLGDCYLNLDRGDESVATFDKAVELAPSPMIWNNIAYQLALKRAHMDRAQQYAESAVAATIAPLRNVSLARLRLADLQQVSSLAAYWDTLGWIYFQRGDLEKAEKYVRASWLIDFHGEVGDHLGQILEKRGQKEEAQRAYAQSILGTRPVPESHARLAALAGGEGKALTLVEKARESSSGQRTVRLGKLLKEKAEADFFVVFAPDANGSSTVEDVKFIRGDEKLRAQSDALRGARWEVTFPDASPAKLIRRGTLTCLPAASECVFVLLAADLVTSLN